LPTALTVAATDPALAARVAALLRGDTLRAYESDDIAGVEVGGAIKNVLAIAAGASDGLGFGHNARAALITRGLAETGRLSEALGGRRETLMGLAGLGDLVLTCTGNLSRNRRVGLGLAEGKTLPAILADLGHVAGRGRRPASRLLAAHHGIAMPICEAVDRVPPSSFRRAWRSWNCGASLIRRTRVNAVQLIHRIAVAAHGRAGRRHRGASRSFRRRPAASHRRDVHGITLTDRYRWLENGKSADVEAWTQQRAATRRASPRSAPPVPGLKDELTRLIDCRRRAAAVLPEGSRILPADVAGRIAAQVLSRSPAATSCFDPTKLDPSGNTALGSIVPNRDGTRAAVATYAKGSEISDFRVIDTTTGAQIGPLLPGVRSFAWARDEQFAYVSPRTAESIAKQEPQRCYRHRLGGERSEDVLLVAMDDAKDYCAVFEPEDADVTVFETGSFWANTLRIRPIGSSVEPRTIWSSSKFRAKVEFRRDRIYFRTNDNAPNWKLMGASYDRPTVADCRCWWPKVTCRRLDVRRRIVIRDKGCADAMFVHDLAERLRELPLPELGNMSAMTYDLDRAGSRTIASFTAPRKVWTIDGRSLACSLLWHDNPPVDTSAIVAEQKFVTAKDGATIPIFIVHRKDWKTDGNSPVYLYGYGGFNVGIEPYFINTLASFVNRGGVFVDAGIRGGNEYTLARQGCSAANRRASTISSRWRNGWCARGSPIPWRSAAEATAACSSARC
jgi:hypothetical protein